MGCSVPQRRSCHIHDRREARGIIYNDRGSANAVLISVLNGGERDPQDVLNCFQYILSGFMSCDIVVPISE